MSSSKQRNVTIAATALLAGSLGLLYAGNFIQFDDTSGYGSDTWVTWLGYVAGYAAASVIVAVFDAPASTSFPKTASDASSLSTPHR